MVIVLLTKESYSMQFRQGASLSLSLRYRVFLIICVVIIAHFFFLEYSNFCGKGMPGLSVCKRERVAVCFLFARNEKISNNRLALVFLTKVMGSSQQVILRGI
jgi:hypothetical protein